MDQRPLIEHKTTTLGAFILYFILIIVGLAVYAKTLHYGFFFDDHPNITKFFHIRHKNFFSLFFLNTRWISLWLNTLLYHIARFEPYFYHLANLIIHLANGSLLYCVLILLFKRLKTDNFFKQNALQLAFVTTTLFLIHPVATQTVCYVIQGQLEGLSTLSIFLMAFLFTQWSMATNVFVRTIFGFLLLVMAALSTGTKEIAIVAPFLLCVIDWFFIAEGSWDSFKKRLWLHALVLLVVISSFCYAFGLKPFLQLLKFNNELMSNKGNILTTHHEEIITPFAFLCSQFKVMLHYIFIYFWPFSISADYDSKLAEGFWEIDCIFPFLILTSLGIWMLYRIWKNSSDIVIFAWLWFFICMVPRASIIPSSELVADYKTYCASVGMVLLLGILTVKIARRIVINHANYLWPTLFLALIPWIMFGYNRVKVWQSSETLWKDIVLHAPTKARAWNNYSVALLENKKYTEAIPNLEKAISLDKHYPDPWNNLSVAYANLGKVDKAIAALEMALRLNPDHVEGYNNLATYLITQEDYKNAEMVLHHALVRRPYYGRALFNLGRIYYLQQKYKEANHYFKLCCTKADLDNDMGYSSWGMTSMILKNYEDAICAYSKAIETSPQDDEIKRHLAYAHLFSKHFDIAEKSFLELYKRNPHDLQIILGLAEMYVITQRFGPALEIYKKIEGHGLKMPLILMRAAGCAYKIGLYDLAGQYLKKYLTTNPPNKTVHEINTVLAALNKRDFSKKSWALLN